MEKYFIYLFLEHKFSPQPSHCMMTCAGDIFHCSILEHKDCPGPLKIALMCGSRAGQGFGPPDKITKI